MFFAQQQTYITGKLNGPGFLQVFAGVVHILGNCAELLVEQAVGDNRTLDIRVVPLRIAK